MDGLRQLQRGLGSRALRRAGIAAHRLRDWFQSRVMVGFSDPKFKRNFRMDRATFQNLSGALAAAQRREPTGAQRGA